VLFCLNSAYAEKIVIWNLEPQSGVTEKEAVTITSILTSEIERISGNKVVSESEMRSVIDGEAMKVSCGADDNSCFAEIGAALGAPFSVSGILSKMGDYWVINVQLVDVRKVEIKKRVTKRFKGEENTLIESLTPIVCELFGKKICAEEKVIGTFTDKKEKKKAIENKQEKKSKTVEVKKEKTPASWKKVTGWTFAATGVVLLAGGIASNVAMINARDDFVQTGTGEDKFKLWRGLSVGGYVSGSVLIAGGITLLIIDAITQKKDKKSTFFYVFPNKDGVVAGFQGRW